MAKYSGSGSVAYVGSAINISAATHNAGTVTITANTHLMAAGDYVYIASVVGMTDLNGYWAIQTAADGNTLTVTLTTAQTYTSGGTVQQVIPTTGYTLNFTEPIQDTTDSDNAGWKTRIAKAITDATGTITSLFDADENPNNLIGESVTLKLYLAGTGGSYWSGSAIFGSIEQVVDVPGDTPNTATYNWEANGAWTLT